MTRISYLSLELRNGERLFGVVSDCSRNGEADVAANLPGYDRWPPHCLPTPTNRSMTVVADEHL